MSVPQQALVLAGGLASRLGPLAHTIPKYLLPIASEPFAHHQLRRLASCGFDEVVICIGHLGTAIHTELGDSAYGMRLRYSDEGPERLGTAGALRAALPLLATEFVLTYGDSYLLFDYAAPLQLLRQHPAALGAMAVFANAGRFDNSNAQLRDGWVARYQKGVADVSLDHIDYGATALRREVVAAQPTGCSDLAPLFGDLATRTRLLAYPVAQRFYEIGSAAGYAELDALLSCGQNPGAA